MANWWEAAPLAETKPTESKSWWEAAPLVSQPATADGRARVRITTPPPSLTDRALDTGKGLLKAVDAGAGAGLAGIGGAVGDLSDLGAKGIEGASNYFADLLGVPKYERPTDPSILDKIPRSKDVQQLIQDTYYDGEKPYQPQGAAETYAKTIGEFLPSALGGGGGMLARAGQVVLPAVASETAGRLPGVRDTKLEPIARFLGALTGGGVSAFLNRPNVTRAALETQLPPGITAQAVDQADALMQDAARRGVDLTWPEALTQVSGRPVLTNLQRHLEASPQSEAQMAEFFAERPQQITRAAVRATSELSPGAPAPPSTIGPAVGQAAEDQLEGVRRLINRQAEPLYARDANVLLSPREMARVERIPGYARARDAVRADEQLSRHVNHLPDNSVGFLNEVKKQLDQASIHAADPLNAAGRNMQISSGLASDATAVRNSATGASLNLGGASIGGTGTASYPAALHVEQTLRNQHLQPLLDGPLGRLAGRDKTTAQAIEVLFPKAPLAHSEGEIGDAVRAVSTRSPRAASDLVRAHAETVFDRASRDLQTGPNQALGGKFRAQIAGSTQQRANLQAAVEALPNGAERWRGFNRFLDIAEATGARQNIGSRTAYNQEIREAMTTAGGVVDTAVKAAGKPTQLLQPLAAKFDLWRARRNLNELAAILTDPRSAGMLRELARTSPASRRASNLSLALVSYANAVRAHSINKPDQEAGRNK